MLRKFKVFVLVKRFDHYGRKADRCRARMKACECGDDEFVRWLMRSIAATDKQVRVLDKLYVMR